MDSMKHYSTYQSQFIEMFGNVKDTRSLCEICRPKQWPTIPTKDFTEDGYLVYGANGVIGHYSEFNHEYPTILMACRGASCGAINISQPNSYITGNAMCMDEIIPEVSFEYLAYFLSNYDYKTIITGGAQPQITYTNLKKVMVPIPPYSEQLNFALIYQQADKSKFNSLKSQFIEMFGDTPERVELSSLCDTFIDGDWIEAKDQAEDGIRLIQTGNVGVGIFKDKGDKARYISEDTFERLNCTEVKNGDILVSRLPDPVGRACIIPEGLGKTITAVDCTIIRFADKIVPKFFIAFTNTPDYAMQIKKVLSGTTRLRVSRANLGKIQVPLPAIQKQIEFVSIAEQADKSKFELRKSIEAIDAVIKSLING